MKVSNELTLNGRIFVCAYCCKHVGYGNLTFACLTLSPFLFCARLGIAYALSLSICRSDSLSKFCLSSVCVSSVHSFKLQIIEIAINYPPIVNRNKSIPTLFELGVRYE